MEFPQSADGIMTPRCSCCGAVCTYCTPDDVTAAKLYETEQQLTRPWRAKVAELEAALELAEFMIAKLKSPGPGLLRDPLTIDKGIELANRGQQARDERDEAPGSYRPNKPQGGA